MKDFAYTTADGARSAVDLNLRNGGTKYLRGGTNLVDLMRENIERPGVTSHSCSRDSPI